MPRNDIFWSGRTGKGSEMRRLFGVLAAALVAVVTGPSASAVIVLSTNVGGNANLGVNGSLVNPIVINNAAGTISIDVDFLKAGASFSLGFNATGDGTILVPDSKVYTVTLTTKNSITPPNMSLGFAMNGFDLTVSDAPGSPIVVVDGLPSSPNPTSDKFAAIAAGNPLAGVGGFRFGGFNGGGGEIYFGETATNTFRLAVVSTAAGSNQNFTLNFVANPEPASLLLGGLAMVSGGFALRRRRKTVAESIEAV